MRDLSDLPPDDLRRLVFIREEARFEVGVLHDRINALISAEAFLTIAFTMAIGNASARPSSSLFMLVAPMLSSLGLILAVLAWPGVNTSYKVVMEWNALLLEVLERNAGLTEAMWRRPLLKTASVRADLDQRHSMLFARAVPALFGLAWTLLTALALAVPLRP